MLSIRPKGLSSTARTTTFLDLSHANETNMHLPPAKVEEKDDEVAVHVDVNASLTVTIEANESAAAEVKKPNLSISIEDAEEANSGDFLTVPKAIRDERRPSVIAGTNHKFNGVDYGYLFGAEQGHDPRYVYQQGEQAPEVLDAQDASSNKIGITVR